MNKKEKYYQYIIRDLLSNTIMEPFVYDFTPFWIPRENIYPLGNIVDLTTGLPREPDGPYYVVDYMREKYGASDEDVKYLWDLYVWHIYTTITNIYE
jgi:hypothetical protein|tara:strand:- start:621 stop:911 length:291 start_codon:yes stop_codon:yes gene_type:complete